MADIPLDSPLRYVVSLIQETPVIILSVADRCTKTEYIGTVNIMPTGAAPLLKPGVLGAVIASIRNAGCAALGCNISIYHHQQSTSLSRQ